MCNQANCPLPLWLCVATLCGICSSIDASALWYADAAEALATHDYNIIASALARGASTLHSWSQNKHLGAYPGVGTCSGYYGRV